MVENNFLRDLLIKYIYIYIYICGDQLYPIFKLRWKRPGPISSLIYTKLRKKGPGPISNLRVREYLRTTNKRRDKITLRGEVESACEELDHVRGR